MPVSAVMDEGGTRSRSSPWGWSGLLAVCGLLAHLGWSSTDTGGTADVAAGVMYTIAIVSLAVLSGVLRTRVPDSPFGWLLFITGSGLFLGGLTGQFIPAEPTDVGFLTYASIMFQSTVGVFTLFYPIALMLYLFPTGRFIGPLWSSAGWFGAVAIPAVLITGVLADELTEPFDLGWSLANPIGVLPTWVFEIVSGSAFVGLVIVMIGGVAAIVVRYRRSGMMERTQIKWLMYPGIVFVIAYLMISVGSADSDAPWWGLLFVTPFLLIPAAITIAITRYRMFEIDRIISRTVAYALVVAVLAALFAAGAVWLPATVLDERQPLFVAGSTLAVAALFNPLRMRVQRIVDRRFNRSAYEAEVLAEDFVVTLQHSLTVDEVAGSWIDTVESALEPESIGLWLPAQP